LAVPRLRDEGGRYGDLTIELAATLAATGTPVSAAERHKLQAPPEAMNMPTDLGLRVVELQPYPSQAKDNEGVGGRTDHRTLPRRARCRPLSSSFVSSSVEARAL
jgi:hypothetical protein